MTRSTYNHLFATLADAQNFIAGLNVLFIKKDTLTDPCNVKNHKDTPEQWAGECEALYVETPEADYRLGYWEEGETYRIVCNGKELATAQCLIAARRIAAELQKQEDDLADDEEREANEVEIYDSSNEYCSL
jgi:hypothetical protein